ncbi:MAG: hypothetical protein HQ521_18900, partial [Bacteroidetes bacterium]|nr:hypothetical protein [Bacteroidota bacterium]
MDKLMQNFQFKTSYLAHIVTIGIATFLIYSNTYAVPFYFDDITSIINSAQTYQGDLSDIYNQFGNRFVAYASFQLNYKLDGLNLWGFHLTNIIVHLLASLSVYLLALQLFIITSRIQKQDPINKDIQYIFAFITALLFAVHPLQIQAVAYIVQRTTALAALFYISTMVSYIQFRTSKSALIKVLMIVLTLLFLLLAFYTKQNTYTLPGALVLIEFIFIYQLSERNYKDLLKPGIFFVVFCVLGLIYVLLFKQTIITLLFAGSRETPDFSRIVYFETQLGVLALYLKLYLLNIGQQFEYVYTLEDGKLINSLGYILSYIALIGFAFWQIKRNAILAFAIIFYFLAHIIESAVIPISDIVFEHRTYLPHLGLSLIVAFLL